MDSGRHHLNVLRPFYVDADCCTACGVPQATAPDLFDSDPDSHCFVKRQPANGHEVDMMLLTMIRSELGCIRYGGGDTQIVRRLAEQGEEGLSDTDPEETIQRVYRDHVALRHLKAPVTAELLMNSFMAYLKGQPLPERYKFKDIQRDAEKSEMWVSWYEDHFHQISFSQTPHSDFEWLIVGLEFLVYDWISETALAEVTFFEQRDWNGLRCSGQALPW
jgi:ferredoxin